MSVLGAILRQVHQSQRTEQKNSHVSAKRSEYLCVCGGGGRDNSSYTRSNNIEIINGDYVQVWPKLSTRAGTWVGWS